MSDVIRCDPDGSVAARDVAPLAIAARRPSDSWVRAAVTANCTVAIVDRASACSPNNATKWARSSPGAAPATIN